MAKEEFDWPYCEHALTIGYELMIWIHSTKLLMNFHLICQTGQGYCTYLKEPYNDIVKTKRKFDSIHTDRLLI